MTERMLIMVAGPYKSGAADNDKCAANLRELNRAAMGIWERGHIPVVGVNLVFPIVEVAGEHRYAELMMPICLDLAKRCDAVLRIGRASKGADQEVALIRDGGGIVFTRIDDIPSHIA